MTIVQALSTYLRMYSELGQTDAPDRCKASLGREGIASTA